MGPTECGDRLVEVIVVALDRVIEHGRDPPAIPLGAQRFVVVDPNDDAAQGRVLGSAGRAPRSASTRSARAPSPDASISRSN